MHRGVKCHKVHDNARVAALPFGQKVTVIVTIHDVMLVLRSNGVGSRNLSQDFWDRFGKIYRQGSINEPDLWAMVEFKFKKRYELQRDAQQTTLGHLRNELLLSHVSMNPNLFDLLKLKALFGHLPEPLTYLWSNSMTTLEEAMDIAEMITEEATRNIIIGDAPKSSGIITKIPKLLCTLKPKKDKKSTILVYISPRNSLRTKMTMEKNWESS